MTGSKMTTFLFDREHSMNSGAWPLYLVITGPVWLVGLVRGDKTPVSASVAVIVAAGLLMTWRRRLRR